MNIFSINEMELEKMRRAKFQKNVNIIIYKLISNLMI